MVSAGLELRLSLGEGMGPVKYRCVGAEITSKGSDSHNGEDEAVSDAQTHRIRLESTIRDDSAKEVNRIEQRLFLNARDNHIEFIVSSLELRNSQRRHHV